jgi:peptidoglycan/LPS O-acetylase OafA/YrhL
MAFDRAHAEFLSTRHFPGLDGLRCLSVLLVVAYHVSGLHSGLLGRGYLGVSLFFAISGFLITTLLLRERDGHGRISLSRFYGRRALRIFPLYYAVIAVYVVTVLLLEKGELEKREFFQNLPAFLTYTSNWFVPLVPDKRIIFYFAWSLATEEQFYLIWPGVMRVAQRWRAPAFMVGLLTVSLVAPWAVETGRLEEDPLWVRILASFSPAICLGCLAAYVVHSRVGFAWAYRVLGAPWCAPALLVLVLAAVSTDGTAFWLTAVVMTALVVACCLRNDHWLMPLLTLSPVRYVGMISYGIYLMHMLALNTVRRALPGQGFTVYFLLTIALSVVGAGLSYRYFESWFLRIKQRLTLEPKPPPGPPLEKPVQAAVTARATAAAATASNPVP